MLTIRPPTPAELPLLKDFAPPDWNTDLSVTFSFHFGQPYFYPIVAEVDGAIAGCAEGLCNGNAGWLGNIIVLPEFRGQGIGYALTAELVEFLRGRGVAHQILIATRMGEPVYRKLGFETTSHYIFLKRETDHEPGPAKDVRPATALDFPALLALDQAITGEQRAPFLGRFLAEAWVHVSPCGVVDGFHLPGLANGPVLAGNDDAGLELLQFRIGRGARPTVVPEANTAALDFLQANGFVETARAPRMVLGPEAAWSPEHVYSRGSGYCG
jgi:GNAT superfamily N-acetyltransferase